MNALQPKTLHGRIVALAVAVIAALCVVAAFPRIVSAHAEIERTSPEANAVLTAPPQQLQLWATEAIASGSDSPSVELLDETGEPLSVEKLRVDPDDPRRVIADIPDVGFGTFTVVWSLRSEADGHTLSGTFAFRVGGTDRAPGAATVEGERPRAWAVATRWITFLGAAVAAAGFLIGPFVLDPRRFRLRGPHSALVAGAAAMGLAATLAEPLIQTVAPPAGMAAPSLADAVGGLPDAWYLRVPGLALAAIVAGVIGMPRGRREAPVWTALATAGASGALVAILGLALTSHAATRESWSVPVTASVVVHQWSAALWTGGLVHLLVARSFLSGDNGQELIRRFSRMAIWLATVAIATGVLNAGLLLPTVRSVWDSDYGRVLIAKVSVLVPVLGLATFHREALRRSLERAIGAFTVTLRFESALIALVVLGGSVLALLAPPSGAHGTASSVDLAAPVINSDPDGRYVRFELEPAAQGENEISVSVTNGPPRFLNADNVFTDAPVLTDISLVRVSLFNLERAAAPVEIELTGDGTGSFRSGSVQLGLEGWWRAAILVRQPGIEDASVPFYLLLPDPNVHGESAIRIPDSAPDGKFLFDRGLNGLTTLSSVHSVERLSGGNGAVVVSDHVTHAATNDQPAALRISTSTTELVRMNGLQWLRQNGGEWRKTDGSAVVPPSDWGSTYEGATAFRLGVTEEAGEQTVQVVSFFVPGERGASAWYAWWVDLDSGRVVRETMIATGHYMLTEFDTFNSAPPVTPPTD